MAYSGTTRRKSHWAECAVVPYTVGCFRTGLENVLIVLENAGPAPMLPRLTYGVAGKTPDWSLG